MKIPINTDNIPSTPLYRFEVVTRRIWKKCQRRVVMATLIKEATLDRMVNDAVGKKHFKQSGQCYCCGSDVEITIEKTLVGYGFHGGVLYESNTNQILMQCEHCFNNIVNLDNVEESG